MLILFHNAHFFDNVRAQYTLVTQSFKITHLRAVIGWSMGAVQSFQWATQYPDFMDLTVPFCGSAKTSLHNQVFLEGVKSAMLAVKIPSAGSGKGGVTIEGVTHGIWTPEEKEIGMKAFGRGYAGW
jgi:S-formylglutathione hydrolase FrmB